MSLDVHLEIPGHDGPPRTAIFVRENGGNREVTRAEWDATRPGEEPYTVDVGGGAEVYSGNITHNLNRMADAAGLYQHLWRPEQVQAKTASDLIGPLADGLATLKREPHKFKAFNPSNGWGDYDGLVDFVEAYLAACKKNPDARIRVSR